MSFTTLRSSTTATTSPNKPRSVLFDGGSTTNMIHPPTASVHDSSHHGDDDKRNDVDDDDEVLLDSLMEFPADTTGTGSTTTSAVVTTTKDATVPVVNSRKNVTTTTNSSSSRKSSGGVWRYLWNVVRIITCDVPLMMLFISFFMTCMVRDIYHTYYVPLIGRAVRTNAQLLQEYTYYDRQCTSHDISTRNIQDLLVVKTDPSDDDTGTSSSDTTDHDHTVIHRTVQQMLQHGVVVIPNLLSLNTTLSLRQYIVQKNARITQDEVYPMSQGYRRLSYGIDAAEHVDVSTAIQEIVQHPIVRPLLTELLGDADPASAEITAIMNYYGATHQAWHQDTKQDGNAIKFARTYSHSYSLFVTLQDITAGMGPTDICPGTQYCTNDLEAMCEEHKMGLHQVTMNNTSSSLNDEAVFPAGYGALLNQHVWHRGGAHVDEQAMERIVFIVSFVARPFRTVDDQRQLSRGTYFHQKWNMWGHTVQDLTNPMVYMKYPYSLFRCLSLYKSRHANWGYDLITATFMRFANGQLEDPDLAERFIPSLIRYGLPSFLHGRVLENKSNDDDDYHPPVTQYAMWTTFIEGTIQNIYDFVLTLNVYAHGIYFGVLLLFSMILSMFHHRSSTSRYQLMYDVMVRHGIRRTFMTHGAVAVVALYGWYRIQSSEWSSNVLSGRTLERPFPNMNVTLPPPDNLSRQILLDQKSTMKVPLRVQKTLPNGYTTVPTRYDVLLGTRYDAPFLGSYNQWLQYHPGNQIYHRIVYQYRSSFERLVLDTPINETVIVTPIKFIVSQILHDVQQQTMRQGRFLQQNWITGDWHIMETPSTDIESMILSDLKMSVNHPVRQHMNDQIAHYRFGPDRETTLSQLLHLHLYSLRQQLLYVNATKTAITGRSDIKSARLHQARRCRMTTILRKQIDGRPITMKKHEINERPRSALVPSWKRYNKHDMVSDPTQPEIFQVGTLVWYNYIDSDEWIPGVVMKVHPPILSDINDEPDHHGTATTYDINVDDGTWFLDVRPEQVHIFRSVAASDVVHGCFDSGLNDCYSGTVLHVYASGIIRVLYDDDEIYDQVPPSMYYIPPYRYEGPFQ